MSVIKKNDGVTTLGTTIRTETARQMVVKGDATVLVAGTTGFDTVKLASTALDTAYTNATANAPVQIGISSVRFMPTLYPEV